MPLAYVYRAFGGPDQEELIDVPKPVPGPGRLLVGVRAAAVNPADAKRRAGKTPGLDGLSFPIGLGREAAGVVEAIGPDVEGFEIGDEVFGQVDDSGVGGLSEYASLTSNNAAYKPPAVSFKDASTLTIAAATGYDALMQLALSPGETLLITGIGGGVGVVAAQIARSQGLEVIGTASDAKRGFVESIGATHVTYGPGEIDRLKAVAPDGVDGLLDLVGGNALRNASSIARDKQKIVTAADGALAKELGGATVVRARSRAVLDELASLVENGVFNPFVKEVFSLKQANEAMRIVESGHARGKVVVEP